MSTIKNILYGGFEGSDEEVCFNSKSLGEALYSNLHAAGHRIVLVDFLHYFYISLCRKKKNNNLDFHSTEKKSVFLNIILHLRRWMVSVVKRSVHILYYRKQYV